MTTNIDTTNSQVTGDADAALAVTAQRRSRMDQDHPFYKWIAPSNTTLGMLLAAINLSIVLISLPAIFRGIGLHPLAPANVGYLLWMVMAELLEPYQALQQPGVNVDVLTGQTFFPHLIIEPFHPGLVVMFIAAAMTVAGMVASLFNPGRYADEESVDNVA